MNEQTVKITGVTLKAKPLRFGYKALGKQSNCRFLTKEQNLSKLQSMLNLKFITLIG